MAIGYCFKVERKGWPFGDNMGVEKSGGGKGGTTAAYNAAESGVKMRRPCGQHWLKTRYLCSGEEL